MENTTSILIVSSDIHPDTVVFRSSNIYNSDKTIHELKMNTNTANSGVLTFFVFAATCLPGKSRNNLRG